MHDPFFVGAFQRIPDLVRDAQSFLQRQRAFGRLALHQLHHQVIRPDVVELADVGMIQRGNRADFAFEAVREFFQRDFDGDIAAHAWIARAIHLAHAARADGLNDFVRTEPGSDVHDYFVGTFRRSSSKKLKRKVTWVGGFSASVSPGLVITRTRLPSGAQSYVRPSLAKRNTSPPHQPSAFSPTN